MSIAADVESLIASLRSKVNGWPSELESYFATFVEKARADERDIAAYIAAEIAHLESVGYKVSLADAAPVVTAAPAEEPVVGAPIA